MGPPIQLIRLLLVTLFVAIFFVVSYIAIEPDRSYYKTTGSSNGGFLSEVVYSKQVDPYSMGIGEFPIRLLNGEYIAHPIVEIVKLDGQVVGYYTKGINNLYLDPILLPFEIKGRALKILEDGSVEEDTKYVNSLH